MNSVPLADVLPWGNDPASASSGGGGGRTYLVTDSVECDGRFVLYSLASAYLSSSPPATSTNASPGTGGRGGGGGSDGNGSGGRSRRSRGRVAWVSCGSPPLLERHVRSALKKMGCGHVPPVGGGRTPDASSSSSSSSFSWMFVPVASEVASSLSSSTPRPGVGGGDEAGDVGEMMTEYVKGLYRRLRDWMELAAEGGEEAKDDAPSSSRQPAAAFGPCLVVLDDVSCLAALFGENLVYALVQRLRNVASSSSTRGCCVALRCSNDSEAERAVVATAPHPSPSAGVAPEPSSRRAAANLRGRWVGAGGDVMPEEEWNEGDETTTRLWESCLVELADGIVDVVPLRSGFSREAHGRLIFTERMGGRGWRWRKTGGGGGVEGGGGGRGRDDGSSSAAAVERPTAVNYVCGDQGVRAIRLRSGN